MSMIAINKLVTGTNSHTCNQHIFCNVVCKSFDDHDYSDLEGLKQSSIEGALMGFTGKQVIHPSQVPVVQEAFSPSPEKIEWATELIKAFNDHQSSGKVFIMLITFA